MSTVVLLLTLIYGSTREILDSYVILTSFAILTPNLTDVWRSLPPLKEGFMMRLESDEMYMYITTVDVRMALHF